MVQNPPHPLFGRPDAPASAKAGEEHVYARPQQFSPHPGYYDDFSDRQAWRQSERAIPLREKLHRGVGTFLYNSIGMNDNLFLIEDAQANVTVIPATGTTDTPFTLDRDLILDAGLIPSTEPGASVYLGVRGFSATALAAGGVGAVSYLVQIGDGPFLLLGTTSANPQAPFILIGGVIPYPLRPDRVNVGTVIGVFRMIGNGIATPAAIRTTMSFTILYSIPPDR